MKVLVFSDNHGNEELIEQALDIHRDCHKIIHCGDSLQPMKLYSDRFIYCVKGNCDKDKAYPLEQIVELDDRHKALVVHGHNHDVYFNLNKLSLEARNKDCNMVIFGHTHRHLYINDYDVHIINPGSIFQSRSKSHPTYCIINFKIDEGLEVEFYNALTNEPIWDELFEL